MSTHQRAVWDERMADVSSRAGQWGSTFISFGLCIDVMYRRVVRHETAWDLVALLMVGWAISIIYQVRRKAVPPGSVLLRILIGGLVAAIIAFTIALLQ